jgi:hypothetical protein
LVLQGTASNLTVEIQFLVIDLIAGKRIKDSEEDLLNQCAERDKCVKNRVIRIVGRLISTGFSTVPWKSGPAPEIMVE